MSATPDSTSPNPEQRIADLERQLAEREAELAEARDQQTATTEVLQIIKSSPGDLAPVFDAMLEKAMRLCEAPFGALLRFNGKVFRAIAARDTSGAAAVLGDPVEPDPGSALERLVLGDEVVHIPDVVDTEAYRSGVASRLKLVEMIGARTTLWVALRNNDVLLGGFALYRKEVRPFTDKQIALLQNFAAQAVIAIENARLLTETRDALDQQTATAEVLGVINSSPGNLAPVWDAMLEKATRLCEAASGILWTYDGSRFRAAAVHGATEEYVEWLHSLPDPVPSPSLARIASGEKIVRDDDLATAPGTVAYAHTLAGMRTGFLVALHKGDALLGAIRIFKQDPRPFSEKHIALVENFAAQAVIAMENARLLTETREALEQQTATAEVLQVINSSPGDLAPVFETMLEKALNLCGAAFGYMLSCDGESFQRVASKGLSPELQAALPPPGPTPGSLAERFVRGEKIIRAINLMDEDAYRLGAPAARALVDVGGVRSYVAAALRNGDRLLGIIAIYRQEVRPFTAKQIALLQNFAAQAVIAMENARLLTETREALEQQTATAEVLGVINSSPGDLAPVFDAILEKAHRLCDSDHGTLFLRDGAHFRPAAIRGVPEPIAERLRKGLGVDAPVVRPLLAGEHFAHILDMAQLDHPLGQLSSESGVNALLSVPLRKGDELFGMIVTARFEAGAFSDKQIALLQNFAAQAVIAMENARLLTETREALEQQTATAEVLQVINSSPGDLTPVFDTILEKAHTFCGATYGGLVIRDRDGFHNVAARGDPGFVERWRRLRPLHPPPGSPLTRLMRGEKVIHLADASADENYRNTTPPEILQLVEFGGLRTLLMVPLRTDNAFLGFITAYRLEVQPFTDKQIALMENFAAQAVIAMENARLLGELRQRTDEVAELNRGLEARVAEQVEELGRVGRLKRFLAPQLAELIVSEGDEKILESHRREIVVVFCDLRGYTAFTETAEPEEVLDFLREYHGALGPLVSRFEGTLDQFSGDGIMVFFNDPVPCPDPAERAVKMAMAMRETAGALIAAWRRRDRELGFGVGIAQGYATLGQIGFAERSGYTAIGTVCNLAARLCAEAKNGQILISGRVAAAVETAVPLEDLGGLALKGLRQPVSAFNVPPTAGQPALRVIEGGPQSV